MPYVVARTRAGAGAHWAAWVFALLAAADVAAALVWLAGAQVPPRGFLLCIVCSSLLPASLAVSRKPLEFQSNLINLQHVQQLNSSMLGQVGIYV